MKTILKEYWLVAVVVLIVGGIIFFQVRNSNEHANVETVNNSQNVDIQNNYESIVGLIQVDSAQNVAISQNATDIKNLQDDVQAIDERVADLEEFNDAQVLLNKQFSNSNWARRNEIDSLAGEHGIDFRSTSPGGAGH